MDLNQRLPTYLTEKKNIWLLIVSTAVFALVFIHLYAPFGIKNYIKAKHDWELLLISSGIILTGVLVVAISRFFMFQHVKRGGKLTILQYLIWILVEIVSMAIFYTSYEWCFFDESRPLFVAFKTSMINTSLVLLLPYSMLWLYFSWRDKDKLLALLKRGDGLPKSKKLMIAFNDEKGVMRFSIKATDLLYMQGSDNYVTIFYTKGDKVAKFMIRNSLKRIEKDLDGIAVKRCHRSYMVNIDKVKLVKKDKEGLKIELESTDVFEIPVSKTYTNDIMQAFAHLE